MRSSLRVHGIWAGLSLIAALCPAQPANAQSFFETLFGGPKQTHQPQAAYPNANRLQPPGVNGGQAYSIRQMPQPRRDDDDFGSLARSPDNGRGGHHTVCVRMCDGYYWPVSYSAPRSRFYRDANACTASCGSEAKLFHYPTSGGQIQDAVDLTGRVYSRLPNAFKYRKALVAGCTCKPEPWSEAEIERHRAYALDDEMKSGKPVAIAAKAAEPAAPRLSGTKESVVAGDASEDTAPETTTAAATAEASEAKPVAAPRKRARERTADGDAGVARTRSRSAAPMPPARVSRQVASPAAFASGWGGPAKYTWPGDAPVRTR